jgi:hypothetical protein
MFGWEELVELIAEVYEGIPEEDRAGCVILCGNYGQAGAVDLFGGTYGLPRAISTHNNYHLWGPGNAAGDVVIATGISEERLRQVFGEVTVAATFTHPYCMPYENNKAIYVCREIKVDLGKAWADAGNYI